MTYRKYRKKPPPRRYCPDCGTYVGRRWGAYNLCDPCRKAHLAEADRRTQERRERFECRDPEGDWIKDQQEAAQ